jgi:hypothetical protein
MEEAWALLPEDAIRSGWDFKGTDDDFILDMASDPEDEDPRDGEWRETAQPPDPDEDDYTKEGPSSDGAFDHRRDVVEQVRQRHAESRHRSLRHVNCNFQELPTFDASQCTAVKWRERQAELAEIRAESRALKQMLARNEARVASEIAFQQFPGRAVDDPEPPFDEDGFYFPTGYGRRT